MVDGYLYFNVYRPWTYIILFIALFVLIIEFFATPQAQFIPSDKPKNKLAIDLILITAFSIILYPPITYFVAGHTNMAVGILMLLSGYVVIPLFYIFYYSGESLHFGYKLSIEPLLVAVVFALSTVLFLRSIYSLLGIQTSLQEIPLIGGREGITIKTFLLMPLLFIPTSGIQEILFRCQQTLIQDIFDNRIVSVIIFVAFLTFLFWSVYEPLGSPILEALPGRAHNLIGLVLMALIFYRTNSLPAVIVYHIMANTFGWLPTLY